jgi:hypothetical protein
MWWAMSYDRFRTQQYGAGRIVAGHTVTNEHPLVVISRWNKRGRDYRQPEAFVLKWYQPLTEAEVEALRAAGLDPSAMDTEVRTT